MESSQEIVRRAVDRLADQHGFDRAPDRLGAKVRALSEAYNGVGIAAAREHAAARLLFSLPRDLPKVAAAVRELASSGRLVPPSGEARVLDWGAGMGASTLGLWSALRSAGFRGRMRVTLVEPDSHALSFAKTLLAAVRDDHVTLEVEVRDAAPRGPFDFVLLGQVLSEVAAHADEAARVEAGGSLVRDLLTRVHGTGSLVIVEPALRERTRRLHALRSEFATQIFAPCLQRDACPMLVRPTDWCHEDLPIDLPVWLVPVARAAGLRYEGLTFSYLVLRPDGASLREHVPAGTLRAVSNLRRSKGKSEIAVCGPGRSGGLMRLDRHASEDNAGWDALARGMLFVAGDEDRVRADTPVTSVEPAPAPLGTA